MREGFRGRPQYQKPKILPRYQRGADDYDDRHRDFGDRKTVLTIGAEACACLRKPRRFSILLLSHPPQADVVAFRFLCRAGRRIRFEASPALSLIRPADHPDLAS